MDNTNNIRKIVKALNMPSDLIRDLGFDQEANLKAEKERAERFLSEKIAQLLSKERDSENIGMAVLKFTLPGHDCLGKIHPSDFKQAFFRLANKGDSSGSFIPIELLDKKQLKLQSISVDRRESGYSGSSVTWMLGFEDYDPLQPVIVSG